MPSANWDHATVSAEMAEVLRAYEVWQRKSGGAFNGTVVPESAEMAGLPAIIAAGVGLFWPILLHRLDDTLHALAA